MAFVTCPSCAEKGKIPVGMIGRRIKCQKCGTAFLVSPPARPTGPAQSPTPSQAQAQAQAHPDPALMTATSRADSIDVDGLDGSEWMITALDAHDSHLEPPSGEIRAVKPAATPRAGESALKVYKLLTQKDKWFDGKFDLVRLEDAINHYARQGWVVRSMTNPHVPGFSGGSKEEIVVLLERPHH